MKRYFSVEMSGFRFLRNVLLFSLVGLVPVLLLYVILTPGLASSLSHGGSNLQRFLRQVMTNGLPVVIVVNYVGFFLHALSTSWVEQDRDPTPLIQVDVFARIVIFFVLHAVIYILSANWYGSFGGSRSTALTVVAPTLARSAYFENISGVYLYATMISAIPLYLEIVRSSQMLRPVVERLPAKVGPVAIALMIFGLAVVLFTALASFLISIQS